MSTPKRDWESGDNVVWTDDEGKTHNACVDEVIHANEVRIMLGEEDEYRQEWVHPFSLAPLDVVSKIGLLENARTLEEQLAEIESEERAEAEKGGA